MLRYFVASNFWLFWSIVLVVGAGEAPDRRGASFFGFGGAPYPIYVGGVVVTFGLAFLSMTAYRRSAALVDTQDFKREIDTAIQE